MKGVLEAFAEVRRIRRVRADWQYINTLSPHMKATVKIFIKAEDIRLDQSTSGLDHGDFRELLKKAQVPIVP